MIDPQQMFDVLTSCSREPCFPSQAEVSGFDSFNHFHQSEKQPLFDDLHTRGSLQLAHMKRRRTPASWMLTPKGRAELDLLSRQLKLKAL
jgi:hypothetical protein